MSDGLTDQERNNAFTQYLRMRLFGLVASVERPSANEVFPMASGVIVNINGYYVLLTAAHFLRDVKRWRDEGRLRTLVLMVNHTALLCTPVALDLEENPTWLSEVVDVGFVILTPAVVAELAKFGGVAVSRGALELPPTQPIRFFLVGHASAYCKVLQETIATQQQGTKTIRWTIARPGDLAVAISRIELEGKGKDPGTLRFALLKGFDDYSGTSGGPIFGYAEGARFRDYCLVAIQSKQILSASRDPRPTHLIATSASLAVRMFGHYLGKQVESNKETIYNRAAESRLRRLAKKHDLVAKKSRRDGLWAIADPSKNAELFTDGSLSSAMEWLKRYVRVHADRPNEKP
jgi:hypothetical protein